MCVYNCIHKRLTVDQLTAAWPPAADEAQLAQLFREIHGSVEQLSCLRRKANGHDRLEYLPELLEDAGLDVNEARWTYDSGRLVLEAGAHVSQRTDKAPIRWPAPLPGKLPDEIDVLVAHGCNLEYRRDGQTALQRYCDRQQDVWTQTGIVAKLIAAGADYRLGVRHGKLERALDGTALECLYEWDAERGLSMAEETVAN